VSWLTLGWKQTKRQYHDGHKRRTYLKITAGRAKNINPRRKLSIAAVAEEAGVSTATIHNRYPEIAEKVRQLLNKEDRRLRVAKGQELQTEKTKRKELNDENRELRQKIAELVSRNATLEAELDHLRAVVEGNNVSSLNAKASGG
jgi:AcrR family transcriptional regulator